MTDETSRVSEKAVEAAAEALAAKLSAMFAPNMAAHLGRELSDIAFTAALPHLQPHPNAGQAVKPLDWDEYDTGWWEATPLPNMLYEVLETDRGSVRTRGIEDGGWTAFSGTLEEAKAAAQADFEARIRSALSPIPAAPVQSEAVVATKMIDAWRVAFHEAYDKGDGLGSYNDHIAAGLKAAIKVMPLPAVGFNLKGFLALLEAMGHDDLIGFRYGNQDDIAKLLGILDPEATSPQPVEPAPAEGSGAVAVTPLDWETCKPSKGGRFAIEAKTSFGSFRIERSEADTHFHLDGPGLSMWWDEDEESARAAVDEYYAGNIRSALAPSSEPAHQDEQDIERLGFKLSLVDGLYDLLDHRGYWAYTCPSVSAAKSEALEMARRALVQAFPATDHPDDNSEPAHQAASGDMVLVPRSVLQPLSDIAERDIGTDEADDDIFQHMPLRYAKAGPLRVGHLRAIAAALTPANPAGER